MTLDGARKALRRHRADSGVPRDAELMERLQHIRSLLVEVREQLKESPSDEVYSDRDADREPAAGPAPAEEPAIAGTSESPAAPAVAVEAVAEEPVLEPAPAAEPETGSAEEPADGPAAAGPEPTAATGNLKKSRRKKDDDDNHELFAYYEQSLF